MANHYKYSRLVEQYYAARRARDYEAIGRLLASNARFIHTGASGVTPISGRFEGRDNIERLARQVDETMNIGPIVVLELTECSDGATATWRLDGQYFRTREVTRKNVTDRFKIKGGKIVEIVELFDPISPNLLPEQAAYSVKRKPSTLRRRTENRHLAKRRRCLHNK